MGFSRATVRDLHAISARLAHLARVCTASTAELEAQMFRLSTAWSYPEGAGASVPEAVHDGGRVDQRGWLLEEPVEADEVLECREAELLADPLLLGPDVAEGLPLEVEYRSVFFGEFVHPHIFPLGTDDRARTPEQRGGGESDG